VSPPSFDTILLTPSYTDASGNVTNLPDMEFPASDRYGFSFWIPSDVPQGNITLTVKAQGSMGGTLSWESEGSTIIAVAGDNLHAEMLAVMAALSAALAEIDGLNATILASLDEVETALSDTFLQELNSTQSELNTAINARLDELEVSVADNSSALEEYIALRITQMELYVGLVNTSLHEHLAAIEAVMDEFRTDAMGDLDNISTSVELLELNDTVRKDELLAAIDVTNDLIEGMNASTIEELKANLADLRDDLAELNTTEGDRHASTVGSLISRLEELDGEVSARLDQTDAALIALNKLDTILSNLERIGTDVEDTKGKISDDQGGVLGIFFFILVLLLVTLAILFLVFMKLRSGGFPPSDTEDDMVPVSSMESALEPLAEEVEDKGDFELTFEDPIMAPPVEPVMITPIPEEVPPPEVPPAEVPPPEVPPPELPPPEVPPEAPIEEVPPPELPPEEVPPPELPPEEVPPEAPLEEVPPPEVPAPEVPSLDVPPEAPLEEAPPPELEPPEIPPPEVPSSEESIEEIPPEPAPPEAEPVEEVEPEPTDEEEVEEKRERKGSMQDWVLEEILEEIEPPKDD
jgi:hypothetical protein